MGILLSAVFILLFSWIILRSTFFNAPGLGKIFVLAAFYLKLLAGLSLYLIYSNYYTLRDTSDAFRYFDDARIIYEKVKSDPLLYGSMVTGIGDGKPEAIEVYSHMNHWYLEKGGKIYNDNRTIIRFNALIMLVSRGEYFVHVIFMCFLSLAGLLGIYRFLVQYVPDRAYFIAGAVFLIPSVFFWGSGVLKEGLLLLGLGGLLYNLLQISGHRPSVIAAKPGYNFKHIPGLLLSIALLVLVKVYVLISLFPGLVAWLLVRKRSKTMIAFAFPFSYLFFFLLTILAGKIDPRFDPLNMLVKKQQDFILLARGGVYGIDGHTRDTLYFPVDGEKKVELLYIDDTNAFVAGGTKYYEWINKKTGDSGVTRTDSLMQIRVLMNFTHAGSKFDLKPLDATVQRTIMVFPFALFNTFFRPLPGQSNSLFMWINVAENFAVLLIVFCCLVFMRKISSDQLAMILFCLCFSLALAFIIGATTPVAGAIVRYKVPFLPFFLAAFFMLLDTSRFKKQIK